MIKIKRALISVSDKTNITELAKALENLNIEIISTGGTASLLKKNNIKVIDVSNYTEFPEMLDGRVKTLHPRIHGGILAQKDNPKHLETLKNNNIPEIDLVVVNLYPFEETIADPKCTTELAIENIDIGGPTMIRAAAKNYKSVAVLTSPEEYDNFTKQLIKLNAQERQELWHKMIPTLQHNQQLIFNLKQIPRLTWEDYHNNLKYQI